MLIKILKKVYLTVKSGFEFLRYQKCKSDGNILDINVKIGSGCTIVKTKFGRHSGCNNNCIIINSNIGNYTNIAWDVHIGPRTHIYTNFTTHDFIYKNNEFLYIANNGCFDDYFNQIGHDVWIGCNVTILPGVEIGNGAIVAAGSIVTKSVPPYAIIGGNPAKFIKWRFTKEQIEKLEETKWYEWDVDKILKNKDELEKIVGFEIDSFSKKYKKVNNSMKVER